MKKVSEALVSVVRIGIVVGGLSAAGCGAIVDTVPECRVRFDEEAEVAPDESPMWEAVFIGDCPFECRGVSEYSCQEGWGCVKSFHAGTLTLEGCHAEQCHFLQKEKPDCAVKE